MESNTNIGKSEKQNRIEYLDLLRIMASVAVIIIHICSSKWYEISSNTVEWNVLNIYDSLLRWTVPVFVMISGVIFLSKDYSIEKLYKKNILRMIIILVVWSLIYAIIDYLCLNNKNIEIKELLDKAITGYLHMWYLTLAIGLYIMVPIFKQIITSKKITTYFLVIIFVFFSIIPQVSNIMICINNEFIHNLANKLINSSYFGIYKFQNSFMVYSGYFVLGYYLHKINITKRKRILIYGLGIFSGILTILCTILVSTEKQQEVFYHYFNINVALEAIAIFVFAKYNFNSNKAIRYISKCTLGIYLLHLMIIEIFNVKFNLNVLTYQPILSIPILTILIFLISVLITSIINKIPLVKEIV